MVPLENINRAILEYKISKTWYTTTVLIVLLHNLLHFTLIGMSKTLVTQR